MYLKAISGGPARQVRASSSTRSCLVIIVCPGGLEHGGGIGRQMGYFLAAQDTAQTALCYRVLDSRGPWFLGAAPYHAALAALYFAWSLCRLAGTRLSRCRCIVHVNITGRGSTLRKLILTAWLRLIGVSYLLHIHDYDYAADYRAHRPWLQARIRFMFKRANKVLVLGQSAKVGVEGCLRLNPGLVNVLPNAVPDPRPGPVRPSVAGRCNILFLGHLSARKGVPELLAALGSETLSQADWHATLAGGGPIEEFRCVAEQLGLAGRVTFTGWVDEGSVQALCREAEVLVLPSHAEGLAMSVLEGLAHGLAVVTTPVGAHPEVIEPDVSGLLVPPGDVLALGQALLRLIEDLALRTRLQTGARSRFLERFCIRDYARCLGDLHAQLLADV